MALVCDYGRIFILPLGKEEIMDKLGIFHCKDQQWPLTTSYYLLWATGYWRMCYMYVQGTWHCLPSKHSITFRSKLYIFVSHVQQMLYLEKRSICTLRGSIRVLLAKVGHYSKNHKNLCKCHILVYTIYIKMQANNKTSFPVSI